MSTRDPHVALKTEIVSQTQSRTARLTLVRLQWSKNDIGFSLHIDPTSWGTSGLQTSDFLAMLGLQRGTCAFNQGGQCYSRMIDSTFDVADFGTAFDTSYRALSDAQRHLESCGLFFEQPEGWGYFHGSSSRSRRIDVSMPGDGHSAAKIEAMKRSEDANFEYRFTWLDAGGRKGWVIHFRPKHPPLSAELSSVLHFLGLHGAPECPEFDFEPCHWRSIAFVQRGSSSFDSNVESAHAWFDAHAANFSPGIEKLLAANAGMEAFGLRFLPFEAPQRRLVADIERRIVRPAPSTATPKAPSAAVSMPAAFDVALSFAGAQREHAQQLASILRDAGYSVFYDDFYPEDLWGKNLVDTFAEIYRKRSRFCAMFISKEYNERNWTNHERQHAQARAHAEKGNEYILPIRVDDTELDGMPPTVGYVSITIGIEKIGSMLINKLRAQATDSA